MPLKGKVAKADFESQVPEALRAEYTERDGFFYLQAEGIKHADEIVGLETNKNDLLKEKKSLEAKLKELSDRVGGIDLDEYKRLKSEAEDRENKKLKAEGKIDEIIEKWKKDKEASDLAWAEKLKALQSKLDEHEVDAKLYEAARKGGIMPDREAQAVTLVKLRTQKTDKGDLLILDQKGLPLDVTVERFFSDVYKEEAPWFYGPSKAGGGGAPSNGGANGGAGSKQISRAAFDQLPPAERMEKMKSGYAVTD